MRRGLVMRRFRGDFLAHLGLLGPGRLLASFALCWGDFGPHFALGALLGLILDLLEPLGKPFWPNWPKLAQDGPKLAQDGLKLAQDGLKMP